MNCEFVLRQFEKQKDAKYESWRGNKEKEKYLRNKVNLFLYQQKNSFKWKFSGNFQQYLSEYINRYVRKEK